MRREYFKTLTPDEEDRKAAARQIRVGLIITFIVVLTINILIERYDSEYTSAVQAGGKILLNTGIWIVLLIVALMLATKCARMANQT